MTTKSSARKSTKKQQGASSAAAATKTEKKAKSKLSQLDAAAQVLADAKEPMNTKAMVEVMEQRGFWKSPDGKTPAATLYSAILREIQKKGAESRFQKAGPGSFSIRS
jgi:hypothetical protein